MSSSGDQNVLSFSKKKNDRRKALKQFYKLQESNRRELENLHQARNESDNTNENTTSLSTTITNATAMEEDIKELTLNNFEEFVRMADFKTLIAKENQITDQLNSNQSEIKSIIYNNYYELIKINNYLENLKNGTQYTHRDSIHSQIGAEEQELEQDQDNHNNSEQDTNEFTIGIEEEKEEEEDNNIKILKSIRENISAIRAAELTI